MVAMQRKELTKHKFWSCKCTKVQNWEVWGMIRVWFGHDSGYDSETHLFWNSGSFVAWVSFSHRQPTTIATLSMAAMARPARRPWTGPEHEECEDLNAHHIYDLYPPACRRLFWMFFSCTFSSATLRLMFLFDGVLVWLPASQPASRSQSHPPHQPHQQHSKQLATQPASCN